MRRLKGVYPEYSDRVAFLAVSTYSLDDAEMIRSFKESEGFTWAMALPDPDMLRAYNIVTQASKVAVDGNGVITFRTGYGNESEETWRRILESLTAS